MGEQCCKLQGNTSFNAQSNCTDGVGLQLISYTRSNMFIIVHELRISRGVSKCVNKLISFIRSVIGLFMH